MFFPASSGFLVVLADLGILSSGIGFIGRHLALYLHENNLASEVRLVDKVLPQLAWLAPEFQEACSQDKFVQADASRERKWCIWFQKKAKTSTDPGSSCRTLLADI